MNDKQRRRYERLARVRDFGTPLGGVFPPASIGGKALTNIGVRLDEIETLEAARNTSQRNAEHGTSVRRDTRNALRAQLTAISETAATIALDHPEFKDKFRLPRTNRNDQNWLGTARSFFAEATPVKARFIEYEMPADFLEKLSALIADFEQAVNQQNLGKGGRRANSTAIDTALDAAEQELERFDTAVNNKFANDPATLAAWESARRLHRGPKQPKTPPPTPPGKAEE